MKIIKKFNNNVVLALTDNNEEVIAIGKGIGFPATPYQLKDESVLDKIYVLAKNNKNFSVLEGIPTDVIEYTQRIIRFGEKKLKREFNSIIFLTLTDHIKFALQRFQEQLEIQNPLQWEVKHLYPNEYEVGLEAVHILTTETKWEIPKSEAAAIALHFINAQMGYNEMSETIKITTIIAQILSIIKYHYKMDFNEDSFDFTRFVMHIRYFILRQLNGVAFKNDNEDVYKMMELKYETAVACIYKIEKYLYENYQWTCSNDEKLYLIIHIQRLTKQ